MNKRGLLSFALLLIIFIGFGQAPKAVAAPKFAIKGNLVDASNQPVEFATVSVFSESDSTLITGGLTDVDGVFNIPVEPGNYYIRIQFMGFKDVTVSKIEINKENKIFNAGPLVIREDEKLLNEVVVQAERTEMELTLDKKVYNIGKDLSNLGGSASDLLANLPSVEVDVDGNVALRGSQNVQILVDGKPSGLVGLSGTGGLQQLQGNLIERVEIITNPSARYDAEGGAGIINIILKKDRAKGFNGSFQVQGGIPANNGASVNVNYRTGWINWFVNYGVTARTSPGLGYTNNSFNNPARDTIYYINQDNDRERKSLSQNIRFGSDIYFNEKNVLTLAASYRNSDSDNTTITGYEFFNRNQVQFSDRLRIDNEDEEDLNWQYELNYNRDFKRKGQKLTFTLQQQDSEETERSLFDDVTNYSDGSSTELAQRARNDNGEDRQLMQLDYIHPFGKDAKLELGTRYNSRTIFNNYIVESDSSASGLEQNFEEVVDLTNNFSFEERIFALYGIVSNKYEKFSWQLGLRAENTNLDTQLIPPSAEEADSEEYEPNSQNYFSLFPSANLTYKYSKISSLQLSYSRRISRPRFRNLNPFITYSNPLSLFTGNPDLKPQFTDSYELGILQNRQSSTIYVGLYYRYTTDVVQRIQRTIEEGVTERLPVNLGVRDDIGIEANINYDVNKMLRFNSNINFFNSQTDGGETLSAEATTVSTRTGAFYRNRKLFNAQFSWFYRAPQNRPQGTSKSIQSFDVGLSKDVFKNNGTIALNVRDLFNTRKYRGETITETFTTDSEFQWRRGPTAVVSFTYRLNQKKQRSRGGDREYEGDMDEF
ncbi:TonB-dependent receptor domain-containing protein [Ekhidna sp.]|uniref:TonB-dependent receptor domain-containing protein n=1 Tax=Ekhidna sp. TaxID=2608089 RepID=UPI003B50F969